MEAVNGELSSEGRAGAVDVEEVVRLQNEATNAVNKQSKAKLLLRKILLPVYKPTPTKVFPNLWRSFVAQPAVFEVWYRTRAWRYLVTRGMQSLDPSQMEGKRSFLHKAASYNKTQLWEWHRVRTEKLTTILRCIDDMPKNPKVLVIGPRNEAEVLLLKLSQFPFKDIEAIDIFSYSPLIKVQDMHDIKFPDNTFDIVYAAWVLPYAYDIKKAVSEIKRVLKPGGIVAAGYSHTEVVSTADGYPISGGLKELHDLFAPDIDWIFWQEVLPLVTSNETSTVFRVKKSKPESDTNGSRKG